MDPTAVYLMRNIFAEANYKVGVSSIPHRRVWQVEESYGAGPMIVATVWFPTRAAANKAEKLWHQYLHEYLTDDHGGKEWFALPDRFVKEFIRWSAMSPDGATLKLRVKAQTLTKGEAMNLSKTLIAAIPTHDGRSKVPKTTKPRR